jgi:hypothetical protein
VRLAAQEEINIDARINKTMQNKDKKINLLQNFNLV